MLFFVKLQEKKSDESCRFGWVYFESRMKSSTILINTARGGLVDEIALANALNGNKIYAWATKAARSRLMKIAIENVVAFLNGNPQNVV